MRHCALVSCTPSQSIGLVLGHALFWYWVSSCIPFSNSLTLWVRDKMDAISQTTFWSAFPWMKMFEFRLKFHRSLFLRVQLTTVQHWFRYWLGAVQARSHYLNQWWLDYRRIYASLGLNELIECYFIMIVVTIIGFLWPFSQYDDTLFSFTLF